MIKDNIKIIKDLTKIFLKSAYQDINIINKETKKIDLNHKNLIIRRGERRSCGQAVLLPLAAQGPQGLSA